MPKYRFAHEDDPDAESFDKWMCEIDAILSRKVGIGVDDLPDRPYHDLFDDGVEPADVADEAIADAEEDMEYMSELMSEMDGEYN